MDHMNLTGPFTEDDKRKIVAARDELRRTRVIDESHTGLTWEESLIIKLPGTDFDVAEASFLAALTRGELPEETVDENGVVTYHVY
jgi:hypothetical protein